MEIVEESTRNWCSDIQEPLVKQRIDVIPLLQELEYQYDFNGHRGAKKLWFFPTEFYSYFQKKEGKNIKCWSYFEPIDCSSVKEQATHYIHFIDSKYNPYRWKFYDLGPTKYMPGGGRYYNSLYSYTNYFNEIIELFRSLEVDFPYKFAWCQMCNRTRFHPLGDDKCIECEERMRGEFAIKNRTELTGYLYVAEDYPNICKIGYSLYFPNKRIKTLSTNYHKDFVMKGWSYVENVTEMEKTIHERLKAHRLNGEWFKLSYEEIKQLSGIKFVDGDEE